MSFRSPAHHLNIFVALCALMLCHGRLWGQVPTLDVVYPPGGQAGRSTEVTVTGAQTSSIQALHSNIEGLACESLSANRFRLTIPAKTKPGHYDVWGVSELGISAPRTFFVSHREEGIEAEPNDDLSQAMLLPLNSVINGRLEKPGDIDCYRIQAKRGQRIILECLAERLDSRLRAVLEVWDDSGRRILVNRGYFGIDPLIDFRVVTDGTYLVKIQDLLSAGSSEHYYRLDVDTGPRVAFSRPSAVQRGKSSQITLHGWNLNGNSGISSQSSSRLEGFDTFDQLDVLVPAVNVGETSVDSIRMLPCQATVEANPYHMPGSHASILLGVTDHPVVLDASNNHSPATAQEIAVPTEVDGQLVEREETDWYAIRAQRGEVFNFECLGQRIQSPVDLQISVHFQKSRLTEPFSALQGTDSTQTEPNFQEIELARYQDELRNPGGAFPTNHLDPSGRWVCPKDGRYLIAIRNLAGGHQPDARRIYRFCIRREEPDFSIVAMPRRADLTSLIIPKGGREIVEIIAFRQRGFQEGIRISAHDLPLGIDCPEIWLGPGVDRGQLILSAERTSKIAPTDLKLVGSSRLSGDDDRNLNLAVATDSDVRSRPIRIGTVVRTGTPSAWARLASRLPMTVAGDALVRITAKSDEPLNHPLYGTLQPRYAPGTVLDVAVEIERRDPGFQASVKLIAVGIPEPIRHEPVVLPAGEDRGYLSFYLPPSLAMGQYSFVIKAETTVPVADKKSETLTLFSNPVTFHVQPATFQVEVDPFAVTRVRRGDVIQVPYTAKRLNGFIGKMHTELASPGRVTDIVGLRGRGETFVGQTEKGTLQITINDDAPLGRQKFLRLFTVGVVEDQPIYQGSSILPLEIVE